MTEPKVSITPFTVSLLADLQSEVVVVSQRSRPAVNLPLASYYSNVSHKKHCVASVILSKTVQRLVNSEYIHRHTIQGDICRRCADINFRKKKKKNMVENTDNVHKLTVRHWGH